MTTEQKKNIDTWINEPYSYVNFFRLTEEERKKVNVLNLWIQSNILVFEHRINPSKAILHHINENIPKFVRNGQRNISLRKKYDSDKHEFPELRDLNLHQEEARLADKILSYTHSIPFEIYKQKSKHEILVLLKKNIVEIYNIENISSELFLYLLENNLNLQQEILLESHFNIRKGNQTEIDKYSLYIKNIEDTGLLHDEYYPFPLMRKDVFYTNIENIEQLIGKVQGLNRLNVLNLWIDNHSPWTNLQNYWHQNVVFHNLLRVYNSSKLYNFLENEENRIPLNEINELSLLNLSKIVKTILLYHFPDELFDLELNQKIISMFSVNSCYFINYIVDSQNACSNIRDCSYNSKLRLCSPDPAHFKKFLNHKKCNKYNGIDTFTKTKYTNASQITTIYLSDTDKDYCFDTEKLHEYLLNVIENKEESINIIDDIYISKDVAQLITDFEKKKYTFLVLTNPKKKNEIKIYNGIYSADNLQFSPDKTKTLFTSSDMFHLFKKMYMKY